MSFALLNGAGVVGFTARSGYTVGPAFGFEEVNRGLFTGELFEEFKGAEVAFVVAVDRGKDVGHATFFGLDLLW